MGLACGSLEPTDGADYIGSTLHIEFEFNRNQRFATITMSLMRIVLIGFLIWVAIVIYRRVMQSARAARRPGPIDGGKMVKCQVCSVFLPEAEAVKDTAQRHYCPAHRPGSVRE